MTNNDTPRVWVQCLGCYNAGTLTGKFFDATEAPETMEEFDAALGFDDAARARNNKISGTTEGVTIRGVTFSPDHGHPIYGPHEELWVTEHEGFGRLLTGECSVGRAKQLAELIAAIEGDKIDIDAVIEWATEYAGETLTEWDAPTKSSFEDAFQGHYKSEEAFAREWYDEMVKGQYKLVLGLDPSRDFGMVDKKQIHDPAETWPYNHIDWDSATDDLLQGFHTGNAPKGGVYIFRY